MWTLSQYGEIKSVNVCGHYPNMEKSNLKMYVDIFPNMEKSNLKMYIDIIPIWRNQICKCIWTLSQYGENKSVNVCGHYPNMEKSNL